MSEILFRVENDLAKYPEMHDALAGFREILNEWQKELKKGTLAQYFSEKGEGSTFLITLPGQDEP